MAQAAPQQTRETPVVRDGVGAVAAGGPIADMQRSIADRLTAVDRSSVLSAPAASDGGAVHRLSRLAGPALLAAAYAAVAIWWF